MQKLALPSSTSHQLPQSPDHENGSMRGHLTSCAQVSANILATVQQIATTSPKVKGKNFGPKRTQIPEEGISPEQGLTFSE